MKRGEVFERLSPPPGGLADLRARLDRGPSLLRSYVPAGAALVAAAAVFLFAESPAPPPDLIARAHAKDDGAEIVLGLAPAQKDPVVLGDAVSTTAALERVPTSRSDVAFYWVGSTR